MFYMGEYFIYYVVGDGYREFFFSMFEIYGFRLFFYQVIYLVWYLQVFREFGVDIFFIIKNFYNDYYQYNMLFIKFLY